MTSLKFIQTAREAVSSYNGEAGLHHLLAVIIGPRADETMTEKFSAFGIRNLPDLGVNELMEFNLSKIEAQRVAAAFQLARKWMDHRNEERYTIRSPDDAAKYLDDMRFLSQEHFVCLCLNTKNEVLRRKTVFVGSLNASIVHPREIYNLCFRTKGTASIIVAHNHPSGQPDPSREDIDVTKRLVECGRIVGVDLLDHVIIGEKSHVSLKEKGYI